MPSSIPSVPRAWSDADEAQHIDSHVEAWWWWARSADRSAGMFVGLEIRGDRFDYWAGLVRTGEPYLYIAELDGTDLRAGLEIKPAEMWADHVCDAPFQQWSLGNEAHGVLLDDPLEAWRRAYGIPVPVTFDVEWYATAEPEACGSAGLGAKGYRQQGEVDCRIQLTSGVLEMVGPAERLHVWGVSYLPTLRAMPVDSVGLRAPYRRSDGILVDQVCTDRWWVSTAGRAA